MHLHKILFPQLILLSLFITLQTSAQTLGVTFHQPLASLGLYIWVSRLEFSYPVQTRFTDADLSSLAHTAFNSMTENWSAIRATNRYLFVARPTAVTLLAQGNSIYITSSLRPTGPGALYYNGSLHQGPVLGDSLIRCQLYNGPTHRAAGHCGEVFLAHMLLKNSAGGTAYASLEITRGAKVVTVVGTPSGNIVVPPCTVVAPVKGIGRGKALDPEQEKWGCSTVIEKLGLVPISPNVAPAASVTFQDPLPEYLHFCFDNTAPSPVG